MIRVRNTKGEIENIDPDTKFVEVCDADGDIIYLIFENSNGEIFQVDANSPMAERYSNLFKVKFIDKAIKLV